MAQESESLTSKEAGQRANVSDATIRHAIRDGRLPAVKRGRDWWISVEDIDRYIAGRRTWKQKDRHPDEP